MSRRIEMVIDKDERGEYAATVYDGDTILAEVTTEDMEFLIECCGFKHSRDINSFWQYFLGLGVLDKSDSFRIIG